MKRTFVFAFLCGLFLAPTLWPQSVQVTKRTRNEIRQGPANYYPLMLVIGKGVPVRCKQWAGGWVNIGADTGAGKIEGWMPKLSLVDARNSGGVGDLKMPITSMKASPTVVAAAIRGFALRYGKTSAIVIDSMLQMQRNSFTSEEYSDFRRFNVPGRPGIDNETIKGGGTFATIPYEIDESEEGIGLGIAARVAGDKLVRDSRLHNYVNMLMTYLVESTGAYDYPFKVYLLNDNRLNAIALPGGYIFISMPMLKTCGNEAELAGVLAHEMMHVILRHGLKELAHRKIEIRADELMQELEGKSGSDSVAAELEDFAQEAYDLASKPRLLSYEEEADRGAAVVLARAGYDPNAVTSMVAKIEKEVSEGAYASEDNPFAGLDFTKRRAAAVEFIGDKLDGITGVKNESRFLKNVK